MAAVVFGSCGLLAAFSPGAVWAAPLFDGYAGWSVTPATEPNIDEMPAAGATRVRATVGIADLQQAYVAGLLSVESAGVNPAALSVTSGRTMTAQFVATEDARLYLNSFLVGALNRVDQGMPQFTTSVVVTDATDAAAVLRVRAADDPGHWTQSRAANGILAIDDTLFQSVNITRGHTYSIVASFQASAGTIPINMAGEDVASLLIDPATGASRDYFYNNSFAVLPRGALTEWRGADGIRATQSQMRDKFVAGLALSGLDIRVGMIEPGRPITEHADLPAARLNVINTGHFPAARTVQYRDEHALAVAGIIAAGGGHGVAPAARIYSVATAASDRGMGTALDVKFSDAVTELLAQSVTVINVSAKFPGPVAQQANIAELVNDTVKNRGVVFVSSAGNDGQFPGGGVTAAPAAAENAINVGAVDRSFFQAAYFSTSRTPAGGPPHVVAPGEFINTALSVPLNAAGNRRDANPPNDYGSIFYGAFREDRGLPTSGEVTGTSFSAPMAAGTVALYQELVKNAKFAAVRASVSKPSAIRAAIMSGAAKRWRGTEMRYKDGTNYTTKASIVQRQGFDLYREIGAGFLDAFQSLRLLNDRSPIVINARAGGSAFAPPEGALLGDALPQLASDDPGTDPLARMILADDATAFVDTFNVVSHQQQEIAFPRPLAMGESLRVTISWNIVGAEYEPSRDLDLAIGLYKDNDLEDGIGNSQLISMGEISFDAEGVILPPMLGRDPLARTADGGWNSAEHLYYEISSPEQEGYYYFRVFNLSSHVDEYSVAGLIVPVPEPSGCLLAAVAAGFFVSRRRGARRRKLQLY